MPVAELCIYHTPHPSATRRVSPDAYWYASSGGVPACLFLLCAVVAIHAGGLDRNERVNLFPDFLERLVERSRPPRAMRYRIQNDRQGLLRSRHWVETVVGAWTPHVQRDTPPVPQIVGALVALDGFPEESRMQGLWIAREALAFSQKSFPSLENFAREVCFGNFVSGRRRESAGPETVGADGSQNEREFYAQTTENPSRAVTRAAERQWALSLLGFLPDSSASPNEQEVNRAYRRLVWEAHPDHGAPASDAADRLEALQCARSLLTNTEEDLTA